MKQLNITFFAMALFTFLTTSCSSGDGGLCGEIDLGNRFVLYLEQGRNQIIYCTSDDLCCNVGWNAAPSGVTEYGQNDKWIIAKTKADEYWIIDKEFQLDLNNCDQTRCFEKFESQIKGPLDAVDFNKWKANIGADLELKKL